MGKAKEFSAICLVDQYGNVVDNINRVSNIGELSDYVGVPHIEGVNSILAHLNTAYEHAHGTSFIAPDHADSVELTASASAWSESGDLEEIIAANAITKDFDIHWVNISAISENAEVQIDLYAGLSGSESLIGSVIGVRNAVMSQEGSMRVQIPQQPANTRITARLSSSTTNATTANVKVLGHTYG